jgi:hypothetical protein
MKHVTTEMTLRYASLAAPTIRVAYEEAMNKARNRLALTISPVGKPIVSGHRHVGDTLASRCVRESDRPPRHVLGIGLAVARRRVIQQHSVDLRPLPHAGVGSGRVRRHDPRRLHTRVGGVSSG